MELFTFTNLLLIITSMVWYLYYSIKRHDSYWWKKNVPFLKTKCYMLGHDLDTVTGKVSVAENIKKIYADLAPHKFGGIFSFIHPVLIVRDPELIKKVLTKDFNHFTDRGNDLADRNDILTLHIFNLTGDEWKTLRAKMTPTFTSGKIKMMFPLVKECSDELLQIMHECCLKKEAIEMKDILARYSNDIISSCAFGLNSNSLRDSNAEFRRIGQKLLTPTIRSRIRDSLFTISPQLTKSLGIKNFEKEPGDFFIKIIRDAVEYREKNNITRNDFLNLLMNLKNEEKLKMKENSENEKSDNKSRKNTVVEFNLDILIAQCFVFFVAGFETSSSTLSFALLELAKNPDTQRKLQQEIDEVLENYDGQFTYESLQAMPYADQVIFESMRMYPALPILVRTCTLDYPVPDSDFIIEKGNTVFIPVYGLHTDPTYFPNPEQFNPGNFSEESKASRPQYVYLPFGDGPRVCIGMRFALLQVKLALVTLLKNFDFNVSSRMQLPFKFTKHSILTNCDGGIWLNCVKRSE